MRLLLLLAALLLPALAAAAPACWPDVSLPITFKARGATGEPPKIGEVVYAASAVGLVWGYSCIAPDGSWRRIIAGGSWDEFPRDWLAIVDAAMRGTAADRAAVWDKHATATAWDERLRQDLDAVWALLPVPPPPSAWKVLADPFRADKRRLVFTVVGRKRGPATSPAQYVDAGAPCDAVTRITEGALEYLSVLGDPAKVARCTQQ